LALPEPEPELAPQGNVVIREVLVHGEVRSRWPWFVVGLIAGTVATILAFVIAGGIG
jgi:hypothetical protein